EEIGHFLERSSASHQTAGNRMAEYIGASTWRIDSGSSKRANYCRLDGGSRERRAAAASAMLDKHSTFGRRWPLVAQVGHDGMPRLARQGQHRTSTSLAGSQLQRSTAPVDVLEAQFRELTGPQSQRRKALH